MLRLANMLPFYKYSVLVSSCMHAAIVMICIIMMAGNSSHVLSSGPWLVVLSRGLILVYEHHPHMYHCVRQQWYWKSLSLTAAVFQHFAELYLIQVIGMPYQRICWYGGIVGYSPMYSGLAITLDCKRAFHPHILKRLATLPICRISAHGFHRDLHHHQIS